MYLHPDLVDLDRTDVPAELGTQYAGAEFPEGMPSIEHGRRLVESQIKTLGETASALLNAYEPRAHYTAPTLPDLDSLWPKLRDSLTRAF